MALSLSDLYHASSTEKVLDLEKDLKRELEELKQEIEDNDTILENPSRPVLSVPLPKEASHFRIERRLIVDRVMEVSQAQPLVIQSEVMKEEMMNAERLEYTCESIPLLLHQHFIDEIQHLVQCKYLHLLRWKRFCQNTASIEAIHPLYQKRLSHILAQYNDYVQRSQRLAIAREAFLANTDTALSYIEMEDLLIYLRWYVCHLHSMKRFNQFLRVLQWIHISHKSDIAPPPKEGTEQDESSGVTKMASWYQDDSSAFLQRPKSGASRPSSAASPRNMSPLPQPPAINPTLLSTTPMPSSSLAYAAAASGGGIATDEDSLGLPLNVIDFAALKPHLAFLLNIYGIQFNLDGIKSSADEMEMFAAINRKFRQIFQRQEHMKTFKTYDRIEIGQEKWGIDSPTHSLKQEANWLPYVKLKPEHNCTQEKVWTQLRQVDNVDEIFKMQAHFIHISDAEKVQEILQQHATAVRNPASVRPVKVTTNHDINNVNTLQVWKKIYCNTDRLDEEEDDEEAPDVTDFDERDIENVNFNNKSRSGSARKRKDGYDYINTVQMLDLAVYGYDYTVQMLQWSRNNFISCEIRTLDMDAGGYVFRRQLRPTAFKCLDEGEQSHNDPATVQGAYLSFLHLRHLRLRDLQRSVLGMFNYFRSLERTLTINDAGLSQQDEYYRQTSPQNHRASNETDGSVGGGGGLASHSYLHNSPLDFKLSESEFMEFSEVDNHDDFYTVDEGRIHVQDQRGYFIMYDAAIKDLEDLEKNLMLIATHYIEKDKANRGISRINIKTESARQRQQSSAGPGDFDILNYAHIEVDRFGVMMDLWNNETAYMECKRELVDCYMEAYQHVFDRDEKRALAQQIVNIIHQRPRYDLSADYFIKMYRAECVILRQHVNLVKNILDKQIDEQREYNQKVCRDGDKYGLPYRIIPKQPIAVNSSRSALRNVFILEFHPTLAVASRLPQAIKFALQELYHIHKPETILDSLVMEKKFYEVALKEWSTMEPIGTSFSPQLQKDLFSDVFAEDPHFLCEIAQRMATENESQEVRGQKKAKVKSMIQQVSRVMEAVSVRHRLIDAAWETELLAKIYKTQATDMGFDEFHLYMRFVQMEFAGFKEDAGKPPPTFITSVFEDESLVDRYTPGFLYLAIHELDEAHVGRFSYRSRDGVLEIVRPGGLETVQVVLKTQIVHKNALTCAVQQAHACQPVREIDFNKSGRNSPTETKSEKSSLTQLTGMSSSTAGTALAAKLQSESGGQKRRSPEAFMSIQLEKGPSRDIMLNEFVTKKNQMGTQLRNVEEMTKLKRNLISQFCLNFNRRIAQFSLRGQLLSYYNSIITLLDDFPQVRDTYFMMGEANEKKSNTDDVAGLQPDPRTMRKRPRRILSQDGKHVLNIWFIPHHTETLIMFKTLDDEHCVRALMFSLMIVSSLHDMIQYLCAHARLGSSHARLGSRKMEFVSADWGGTEGVGAELREIQKQIDNLEEPTDPRVIAEFMSLRRDVMFLEFDTAVRHCMADTFLSTGNIQAYKSVINNMHHALPSLSNVQRPTVFSTYLQVPEPLEPRDLKCRELFPYRSFIGRNGPYPTMFWQWHTIEYYIQLCLSGLKDVDRHVANGEILGVTLLMEDVLQTGFQDISLLTDYVNGEPEKGKDRKPRSASVRSDSKRSSATLSVATKLPIQNASLSRTQEPIKAHKLLKFFLLLWKCLEYLKSDWGKRKLGVETIDKMSLYKEFCKGYKAEVLLPVLQSVARRLGQGDMYEGIALDTDPLVMPRGASEIEVRAKQFVKLFENLECHMISEIRKKLARELTLVLAERGRAEETALSTDLWKRPVMKESFTIAKPHLTESFYDKLTSNCDETEEKITFTKKYFNSCVAELTRDVMAREKSNFESYTMYYENLLRSLHQNLYQREQEIKQMKDQLKTAQQNSMVDVQCELANQGHDLIMEITALRAKVAEMREQSFNQQKEIRERVMKEYNDLIQNFFNSTSSLKNKFDEFRNELHDDVFDKIGETRKEAFDAMGKVRQKFGCTDDESGRQKTLAKSEMLRELKNENHLLNTLILKMKAMKTWRQNHDSVNFVKQIQELRNESENNKKMCEGMRMDAEEQIILLRQQIVALRKALADSQKYANDVKKELDKELKEKWEKKHEAMQRARSQKQMEQAKQANIEKLMEELHDKEYQLAVLSEEKDKNLKQQSIYQDKLKKDVESTRRQLHHERNLKLDAFQRVDDLQAVVYDYESCVSRTQSAFTPGTPASTGKRSRIQSAHRSQASRETPSSGLFPPALIWPNNRTLTPDMGALNNEPSKKIQRPKTVGGRLRSRIAEQLINELEFDHHQTIVHLEELAHEGSRGNYNY